MASAHDSSDATEVVLIREGSLNSKTSFRPSGCYKIVCDKSHNGKTEPINKQCDQLQKGNPRYLAPYTKKRFKICNKNPLSVLREAEVEEKKQGNSVKDVEGWYCTDEPWDKVLARIEKIMARYPCSGDK